jgi:hypothetical protein
MKGTKSLLIILMVKYDLLVIQVISFLVHNPDNSRDTELAL